MKDLHTITRLITFITNLLRFPCWIGVETKRLGMTTTLMMDRRKIVEGFCYRQLFFSSGAA